MSITIVKVPILARPYAAGDVEHSAVPNGAPVDTPFLSISHLSGEIRRDPARGTVEVELRTGAFWSVLVTINERFAPANDPDLIRLAWQFAGDPTPEYHKAALREVERRLEVQRATIAQLEQDLTAARADTLTLRGRISDFLTHLMGWDDE